MCAVGCGLFVMRACVHVRSLSVVHACVRLFMCVCVCVRACAVYCVCLCLCVCWARMHAQRTTHTHACTLLNNH